MIDELYLRGFRSFRERHGASLAPLTLIYGPNSSGKSSFVRSLLLLKQSVFDSNSPMPRMTGSLVDLGNIRTLAHEHKGSAQVELLTTDNQSTRHPNLGKIGLAFEWNVEDDSRDTVTITFASVASRPTLSFVRCGPKRDHLVLDDASLSTFSRLEEILNGDLSETMFDVGRIAKLVFSVDAMLPFQVIGTLEDGEIIKKEVGNLGLAEMFWANIGMTICRRFRDELQCVSYLGPLRKPWDRSVHVSGYSLSAGVGEAGQDTLALLSQRPDVLSRVNDALHTVLESSYALRVDLDELAGQPMVVPMLEHRESGVKVSPVDAGFGLSQLLPIVVELFVRENSLVCIEQPELHLHPRLQSRVGQLLRNAVKGTNNNRFVIETHSEHLLLRIRRLVREGLLRPSEVEILYVNNLEYDSDTDSYLSGLESMLQVINLDDRGDFVDPWPGGFFDERYEEMPGWSASHVPPIVPLATETDFFD